MAKLTFKIKDDYIELCGLLKVLGWCSSGGEAKAVITQGLVKVDTVTETRNKCKIRHGQEVDFDSKTVVLC